MSDIDDRMSAALSAAANQVNENDLRPADPPTAGTAQILPARRHIRAGSRRVWRLRPSWGSRSGRAAVVHNRHTAAPAGPEPRSTDADPARADDAAPTPRTPRPRRSATERRRAANPPAAPR